MARVARVAPRRTAAGIFGRRRRRGPGLDLYIIIAPDELLLTMPLPLRRLAAPRRAAPRRAALLAAVLAIAGAACARHAPPPPPAAPAEPVDEHVRVERIVGRRTEESLTQRVFIRPAQPWPGDTVTLRSTVVNAGRDSVRVEHVVCGLDVEAAAVLADPFVRCVAYSVRTTLAPGDSLVQIDRRVVIGPRGRYELRVRHLVSPERWMAVPMRIR